MLEIGILIVTLYYGRRFYHRPIWLKHDTVVTCSYYGFQYSFWFICELLLLCHYLLYCSMSQAFSRKGSRNLFLRICLSVNYEVVDLQLIIYIFNIDGGFSFFLGCILCLLLFFEPLLLGLWNVCWLCMDSIFHQASISPL